MKRGSLLTTLFVMGLVIAGVGIFHSIFGITGNHITGFFSSGDMTGESITGAATSGEEKGGFLSITLLALLIVVFFFSYKFIPRNNN